MPLLGTTLTLLIGPTVPVLAPPLLVEALDRVEVTHSDAGRSGFQLTFHAGRGRADFLDDPLLTLPLLRPYSRVILVVTIQAVPRVLMDGLITNVQYNPGMQPGTSTLSVTGEDVSVAMDLREVSAEHPAQPEPVIVAKILGGYASYGLLPTIIPPPTLDMPVPVERTPVQQGTDLAYLRQMAERYGYLFFVMPGAVPGTNFAYWGPPRRLGVPQRALSVNLGAQTNVTQLDFQYDGLATTHTEGRVQDRQTGQTLPLPPLPSTRLPLATQPAWLAQPLRRVRQFRDSGVTYAQALARATGDLDASTDRTLVATGTLDTLRYEGLLLPRALVGVRGVGVQHGGFYYVQRVTHQIQRGTYTQQFSLLREGYGTTTPVVVP